MAQRVKKQVDSNEVREWANETNWRDELDRPVAERGRMPSGLIEAYNRANARYNKEYVPIPRPVRADSRENPPARKATAAAAPAPRSTRNAGSDAGTRAATTQAVAAAAPQAASGEGGVQSLQDVIAMLTSVEGSGKKGGRKAVVTIQTLVDLPA